MNDNMTLDLFAMDTVKATDAMTEAQKACEIGMAKLFAADGKTPIHGPEEHARRLEALKTPWRVAVKAAEATAERVLEAGVVMALEPYADPTIALDAEQLVDVNARRPWVQEDCETLALGDLASRVEWAGRSDNKPLQWLYARYAGKRWQVESNKPGAASPDLSRLGAALRGLTSAATRPGVDPAKARRLRDKATQLQIETRKHAARLAGETSERPPVRL